MSAIANRKLYPAVQEAVNIAKVFQALSEMSESLKVVL